MQHRTRAQIERIARIRASSEGDGSMSRGERLMRWAELLEQQPGSLSSIDGVEFADGETKRADGSPVSVAFSDPILRAAGLHGDSVGDACQFFGLSRDDIHFIVCDCRHGRAVSPAIAADAVRIVMRQSERRAVLGQGLALHTVGAAATLSAVAMCGLALAIL